MTTLTAGTDLNHSYALVSAEARWAHSQLIVAGPPRFDEAPTIIRTVEMRERPFAPAFQKLEFFRTLDPDWDSYGSATITPQAFSTAKALLSDLCLRPSGFGTTTLVPFSVVPVATGGINLEWRRPDAALEVWINAAGTIETLLDRHQHVDRFEEKTVTGIPAAVAEVLAFAA